MLFLVIMKIDKNEKQSVQLEKGFPITHKSRIVSCLENECICRTLEHDFKVNKIIFGSIFFTTHVAALICLIVTLGSGNVCDDKIGDLQLDLEALRTEYDSSLRIIRYKLKFIENVINQKWDFEEAQNHEKQLNFEELDRSTDKEDIHLDSQSSDFNLPENMIDYLDVEHETTKNISRDPENSTTASPASELLPSDELCSQVVSSNAEDFPEYFKLCKEWDVRSRRTKRSNMRGKQSGRKSTTRRRVHPNKKPNIRGPVASHFKGGVPETYIRDGGLLAPWFPDDKASAAFSLKYEFREGKGTIEVTEEGLYLIYAQVYYLTTEPLNTYVINVREKDAPAKPIAYCSSNAVVPEGGVSEVSCYTAVIRYLNATNQVYITQRDRNRRMILRDGHSFMGLICLNSAPEPKRRRKNRD
ncbi:hypothetical protein R5R35_004333 [Gryllus longicercus]|uniref:THD domain-containing protein n=1 Tax=Gryllus longicercus TaxID=2509291 RepID=A0AAN9VK76_9ORTH